MLAQSQATLRDQAATLSGRLQARELTDAVQAISECYGVVGITAPRLHNGRAVFLPPGQLNHGVQVRVVDDQIILEVYVALEYGLRISEIAHNIMSSVKFSIEKMLGVPVAQVNVNVQGLSNSTNNK